MLKFVENRKLIQNYWAEIKHLVTVRLVSVNFWFYFLQFLKYTAFLFIFFVRKLLTVLIQQEETFVLMDLYSGDLALFDQDPTCFNSFKLQLHNHLEPLPAASIVVLMADLRPGQLMLWIIQAL